MNNYFLMINMVLHFFRLQLFYLFIPQVQVLHTRVTDRVIIHEHVKCWLSSVVATYRLMEGYSESR